MQKSPGRLCQFYIMGSSLKASMEKGYAGGQAAKDVEIFIEELKNELLNEMI